MTRIAVAVLGGLFSVVMLVAFYAMVEGSVERAASRRAEQETTAAFATASRPALAVARARR